MLKTFKIKEGIVDNHYGIDVEIQLETRSKVSLSFSSWVAKVERGEFFINGYEENKGLRVSHHTITFDHVENGDVDIEVMFEVSDSSLFERLSQWVGNGKSQNERIEPFEWSTLTDDPTNQLGGKTRTRTRRHRKTRRR